MAIVHDGTQMLGMVDDGDLARDLTTEWKRVNAAVRERAGHKGKAKGSLTITLSISQEGGILSFDGDIKVTLPKKKRSASMYWAREDGSISTEHPQQLNMFSGPREASERTTA